MDHVAITILLFVLALGVFVAELFIPSGGFLTLIGTVILSLFVYRMFAYGSTHGVVSLVGCVVGLPAGAYFALKHVDRLPFGHKIVPPNPADASRSPEDAQPALATLIGRTGRATSPLHPVGMCDFDGRRVQCIAEGGIIESGDAVVAIGISMNNVMVKRAGGSARTA